MAPSTLRVKRTLGNARAFEERRVRHRVDSVLALFKKLLLAGISKNKSSEVQIVPFSGPVSLTGYLFPLSITRVEASFSELSKEEMVSFETEDIEYRASPLKPSVFISYKSSSLSSNS